MGLTRRQEPVWVQALERVVLGTPIPTSLAKHERLDRVTGLAVFASDALSSVAYATEAILLILILAATAALASSVPIALGIAVLVCHLKQSRMGPASSRSRPAASGPPAGVLG